MAAYAHPEVLVETAQIGELRRDPTVRVVEVDVDATQYEQGHIPGAIGFNWQSQLNDGVRRDILSKRALEELLGSHGISNDQTILLYGDNNNWFAAFAFWILKIYGHRDVRLINGGRKAWIDEGREITKEVVRYPAVRYEARDPDPALRAFRNDIFEILDGRVKAALIDVRSPAEFTGEVIAPPGMSETAQRAGHIPGAASVPWATAVASDGRFKDADELTAIYRGKGVDFDGRAIAYCRIGERSSHTWFVLKYLLGLKDVRNYDGSWTEWGSLIDAPIER